MTIGGDWDKLIGAMGPEFEKNLETAAVDELNRVGRLAVRVAKKMIRDREYAKNAAKTIAMKRGSTMPLVNHGDLRTSIRHVLAGRKEMSAIVGANKKDLAGKNIAKKLSDGVRGKGGGWFIPPRPFLSRPLQSAEVQKGLQAAALETVRKAIAIGKNRPLHGAAKMAHERKLARGGGA